MCKCDTNFLIMPTPRKRIGFLPSEEVHEIIEKLCKTNEFSQSKVTGLLVEEALRSRGVLNESIGEKNCEKVDLMNFSFNCIFFFQIKFYFIINDRFCFISQIPKNKSNRK